MKVLAFHISCTDATNQHHHQEVLALTNHLKKAAYQDTLPLSPSPHGSIADIYVLHLISAIYPQVYKTYRQLSAASVE